MKIWSRFVRLGAMVLASLGLALPRAAHAWDEDVQFWLFLNASGEVADGVMAHFEFSPRAREGADLLLVRLAADVEVADGLSLGGGLVGVEFDGGHEVRPYQQILYSSGAWTLRTRLEQRFFAGADRTQWRLRQRAQVGLPLDRATQLSLGAELLYILQSQFAGQPDQMDQWRADVTLRRRLSPVLDASISYRAILSPRIGQEDRLSHVPILTLHARL